MGKYVGETDKHTLVLKSHLDIARIRREINLKVPHCFAIRDFQIFLAESRDAKWNFKPIVCLSYILPHFGVKSLG